MSGSISASATGIAGLAMSAVGTGVGVMGQMQQASAQKASADYQAQVAQGNAQVAQQNATMAAQSGEEKAAIQEQKTRQDVGSELASQASSGVDINSSTSRAVRTSTQTLGSLDAQTIRSDAAKQAFGYQVQASNYGNAASADTVTGKNDLAAGEVGAGASLLSGVGKAGLNYASIMNSASGVPLEGSLQNPAVNNTAADVSYDKIDNGGLGSN